MGILHPALLVLAISLIGKFFFTESYKNHVIVMLIYNYINLSMG